MSLKSAKYYLEYMDEIDGNVYLGSEDCHGELDRIGATHVLSLRESSVKPITYPSRTCWHITIDDEDDSDIERYFSKTLRWLRSVSTPRVIHCRAGISRSATIAIYFLMKQYDLSDIDAIERLNKIRTVSPNDGFRWQLRINSKNDPRYPNKPSHLQDWRRSLPKILQTHWFIVFHLLQFLFDF
jgi:hypothetical protein